MVTKVLLCGLARSKKAPQVNSETLGKEPSQFPEIPQKLSFSLVLFSSWPDSLAVINSTES